MSHSKIARCKVKLVVFDLDGTLIDSKKDIAHAVNLTMKHYGVAPIPDEIIQKYVGTGVAPLIELQLRYSGVADLSDAPAVFAACYLEHLTDDTKLYSGINRVLDSYRSVPRLILTNKSNQFLKPLMQKLDIGYYFVAAYGRESFPTRKPDPGPLLEISKKHKVSLDSMIIIGDSEVDIQSGKNAGTQTCAVTYGYGDLETLKNLSPDYLISKPEDMLLVF